jgi:glycosyltransferase involved in cell wall biosynthesis
MLAGNTAWGMYNFRKGLMKALIESGYQVLVTAPNDNDYSRKIESLGCEFQNTNIDAKGTNPFIDLKLIREYYNIFKLHKPDFIFFFTIKPNIYGSFAAQLANIPHIAVATGLGHTFVKRNVLSLVAELLYKMALKKAIHVWFLNEDDLSLFLKKRLISGAQGRILKGEGIDLERFAPIKLPNETSFLLVARLLWDKGVGEYVGAAHNLKKKYPQVRFKILGFLGINNPSAISKQQLKTWEQEGDIEYLGSADNVQPYIANSTCVVLPSYYREGLPISLLEAAAMARPIITTNNVGCRETVDHNLSGYLCEVKDQGDLTNAMEKIILMPQPERTRMGVEGRKKVETEFDEKLIINQYLHTLKSLLC